MPQSLDPRADIQLSAENIGGIDEASETIYPGVTILVGKNATNRTSFLQAVAAALGTDCFTLKRDAEVGKAVLSVDSDTYTRTLRRTNGHVEDGGDPYLEDPELAELYAVLFESNDVRAAVREGGDIRDLIVRPLDVERINERISQIVTERRRIDEQLDEYDRLAERITACESKRAQYERRLEEVESELERKRAALEKADGNDTDVESRLEEKLDSLHESRTELEEVREKLDIEEKSLDSLQADRTALAGEYEELERPEPDRLATLEERLARLRERKRSLDSTISELQQVIRFNDERLSGADSLSASLEGGNAAVDDLDPDGPQTVCWTCGTEVSRSSIEGTLERLRDLRQQKSAERNDLAGEIERVADTLGDLEDRRDRHENLESKLAEIDDKIERRESTVERLREREAELQDRVADLEAAVETLKAERQSEVLDLQETVSELEFERERVREQRDDVEEEIETLERRCDDRDRLENRRETLSRELQELRSRVESIEAEAIESFNTHMAAILETLEYDNIERIWLEATEAPVDDARGSIAERTFELHVVRETSDGSLYEDRLEHLSESERELVGLVVALSGYLAHDVYEHVPFMLLDSLEMVDGERLVSLASYLKEYVPYLLLVLLPDHARAFDAHDSLPDTRITDI